MNLNSNRWFGQLDQDRDSNRLLGAGLTSYSERRHTL